MCGYHHLKLRISWICLAALLLRSLSAQIHVAEKTTSPPNCFTPQGQELKYGDRRVIVEDGLCMDCSCELYGGCVYGNCIPAMCVDPAPNGACCFICPNERNCRLPSGEVIIADQKVIENDKICECPPQTFMMEARKEDHYMAICYELARPKPFFPGGTPPL